MEITLPTEIPPKRPVLPDNWGEDRSGKVPKKPRFFQKSSLMNFEMSHGNFQVSK